MPPPPPCPARASSCPLPGLRNALALLALVCASLTTQPAAASQGLIDPDPRWHFPHFLGFRPADARAVEVNPPRFSWPYRPGTVGVANVPRALFRFQVASASDFATPAVDVSVDYNFYNTLSPFAPGTWFWRVGYDTDADGTVDQWSAPRSFVVVGAEPHWDRSGHASALATLSTLTGSARPRFGPANGDWTAFRAFLANDPRGQLWLNQLLTSANRTVGRQGFLGQTWYTQAATHFPPTDEDGGPLDLDGVVDGKVAFSTGSGTAVWRSNDYGRVAQNLTTVAFAHKLTGEPAYAAAKDLLLQLASFPHTPARRSLSWPEFHGATTKQTTAITEYLALLYDWYHDDLAPAERQLLRDRVALRVQQVFFQGNSWRSATHVLNNGAGIRGDSHPYQNFFWALPGLLLLAGEDAATDTLMEAPTLLPLTLDFLTGVTASALYGPDDGAINEGVGYGGEKQGTMLRTALMAELLLDLGQQKNPFLAGYQSWSSQALFAGYGRSPFGDQWGYNLAEQVLQNQHALTLLTGNPQARARWDAEVAAQGDLLESHTFSRPWTLLLAYQRRHAQATVAPAPEPATALFPESGWVMAGPQAPTTAAQAGVGPRMVFQSRPRGGFSHSYHAENAFSWHAFGQPLAGGGGSRRYPDPYSRHTMSHNALLINGRGQGWTNIHNPDAPYVGRILAHHEGTLPGGGSIIHWVGDASNAYRTLPGAGLKRWHRHVLLVDHSYFVLYDDLEMQPGAEPARFSWLLHPDRTNPSSIQIAGNEFSWTQNGVGARVVFARDGGDLSIDHQSGTGAVPDPSYPSGSGWAPDPAGNNVFDNPITGEDLLPAVVAVFEGTAGSGSFEGSTRYYFSEAEYAENQRTQNSLWVTNAEPALRWQLMSALLAWPSAQAAPAVQRLGNHRLQVTSGGSTRVISFDPTQPGDYTVDLNTYRAHAGETIPEKPTVSVRRSTAAVRENSGERPRFIIERGDNFGASVTVPFTLTGSATLGQDYLASITGQVHIPAEASEAVVELTLLDDPILETDETTILTILPGSAYTLAQASATITILDDEALDLDQIHETLAPGETREVRILLTNPHATTRTFTLAGTTPAGGYKWNTSTNLTGEPLVPAFTWRDLATSPTASGPDSYSSIDDGVARPVQRPFGFPFPFFGQNQTHATFQTNGFLYFGDGTELGGTDKSTQSTHLNSQLPSAHVPFGAIFPLWDDLRIQPGSSIRWEQTDADTFIVQWDKVGFVGQSGSRLATFQVVLRREGGVTFHYKDFDFADIPLTYTVGLQDFAGNRALQMSHNVEPGGGAFLPKGTNVNFTVHAWPPFSFFALDAGEITLSPGQSTVITVTLTAPGSTSGQFADTLTLTDTHDGSTRQIAVLMHVAADAPPAAPGELVATRVSSSRIDLAWLDRSANETSFRVERSLSADGPFTVLATLAPGATSFSDTTATAADSTRYFYRVVAINTHGESASPLAAAGREPLAPTQLAATALSPTTVLLSWTYAGPASDAFFIERRPTGTGVWFAVGVAPVGATSYSDTVTVSANSLEYRVTAYDAQLSGPPSATASVVLAPAGFTATALSPHDIALAWSPVAHATSHRLEHSADDGATWTFLAQLGGTASTFTDVGRAPVSTHHYRLRATTASGDGPWATAFAATPALGTLTLSFPRSTFAETDGSFIATVTRSGTSGQQIVQLSSNSPRLSAPASVTIPDGQAGVSFTVTIHDDAVVNATDLATLGAFAPAALAGESFTGPAGADVSGQSTGWGWSGAWFHNNTSPVLAEPSLSYSKAGQIAAPGTRAARFADSGSLGEGRRNFQTKFTDGHVWASALLWRAGNNVGTQILVRENPSGGNWARIRYQDDTNFWRLEASSTVGVPLHNANPSAQTLLLVLHFDFTARKIHAYLNPDVSGSAPANALGGATVDMLEALTGVGRLDIAGRSTVDAFDEIRVARSFADLYGGTPATRSLRLIDDEALTPAQQWLDEHFATPIPAGHAAWTADPDADGLPNLLEYALGLDPLIPGGAGVPAGALDPSTSSLSLTFMRARADITYEVLASSTLAPGSWEVIATDPGQVGEEVTVTEPVSENPRRFLRLRVTQ